VKIFSNTIDIFENSFFSICPPYHDCDMGETFELYGYNVMYDSLRAEKVHIAKRKYPPKY